MINRDSFVLVLVILGSIAGYFATLPPPWEWPWAQWMNFVVFASGLIAAKLSASILSGNDTAQSRQTPALGGLLQITKEKEKP